MLLALLLGAFALTFWEDRRFLSNDQWVSHTAEVIRSVEQTLLQVQAAESSQRGYSATGQETYLRPYDVAVETLPDQFAALRQLVADNPGQVRRADEFIDAVRAKLAIARERIDQRRRLGIAALESQYFNDTSRQAVIRVNAAGTAMIMVEERLLLERTAARDRGVVTKEVALALLICSVMWTRLTAARSRRPMLV